MSPPRFVILGGGPAGTAAATAAAALGASVTLVEDSIVGGAAHLWDCIPSKTMTATAIRIDAIRNAHQLGLLTEAGRVDPRELSARIDRISTDITAGWVGLLESQGVEILRGRGRFTGPNAVDVTVSSAAGANDAFSSAAGAYDASSTAGANDAFSSAAGAGGAAGAMTTGAGAGATVTRKFDVALVSTGSAPRVPGWAAVDGERILTTRDAYDLAMVPEHLVVIGSGVTGVEFVHIFESLGSAVTLVVSRQQILPHRDPEVASVLQEDFLARGVKLVMGARAEAVRVTETGVEIRCDDGRVVTGSHALLAVGSEPLTVGIGLSEAGVDTDDGYVKVDEYSRTSQPHIYAAGDCTGQIPLSSVASMQGRKIARHALGLPVTVIDYQKVAQAVFTQPEIAWVGLEDVQAAAQGRKVRTTKVPFAANPRSLLQGETRGFVKVVSDPATGVVLGGTIVGHRASELIGILALAVQARVTTGVLVNTLMVHPSLSESITDAAE